MLFFCGFFFCKVIFLFFTDRKTCCKVLALVPTECVKSGGEYGEKKTNYWLSEVTSQSIFCVLQVIKSYFYTLTVKMEICFGVIGFVCMFLSLCMFLSF